MYKAVVPCEHWNEVVALMRIERANEWPPRWEEPSSKEIAEEVHDIMYITPVPSPQEIRKVGNQAALKDTCHVGEFMVYLNDKGELERVTFMTINDNEEKVAFVSGNEFEACLEACNEMYLILLAHQLGAEFVPDEVEITVKNSKHGTELILPCCPPPTLLAPESISYAWEKLCNQKGCCLHPFDEAWYGDRKLHISGAVDENGYYTYLVEEC